MDFVKLTHENIENEHICCAIANNKDIQVMSKKNWLKDRYLEHFFDDLYVPTGRSVEQIEEDSNNDYL